MEQLTKRLKKEIRYHSERAWEAETRAALEALAGKFDAWRSGAISSVDLNEAIHLHYTGINRQIWRLFSPGNLDFGLAHAVATGLITKDSLPDDVAAYIAPRVRWFERELECPNAEGGDDQDE